MAARAKRRIRAGIPQDLGDPGDFSAGCVSDGNINVCMTTTDTDCWCVTLFSDEKCSHSTGSAQDLTSATNNQYCMLMPAGDNLPASRWAQYSDQTTLSVYSFSFYASSCTSPHTLGCNHCHKPAPARLMLRLDSPVKAGSSAANGPVNRPVLLQHSQDRNFPCCWFSPPIDAADGSGNPAYWMLQKTAPDTWLLCLRRVSHEVAAYRIKSKDSHRFPIKLKRSRVSKDFKKWPRTITIRAAE